VIDPWLLENLVCPVDHLPLARTGGRLECASGHSYAVVDDVPVMLVDGISQTMDVAAASLGRANGIVDARAPQWHLESLGISEDEKRGVLELASRGARIDPVVAYLVAATNGLMYRHLVGSLDRYPIPELPLPDGDGRLLLDVGCSWGRWTHAAARRGYHAVGIDPSLGAIMAARRVAAHAGAVNMHFVVGDARHLPFRNERFDAVYSYSVLQHLSRENAAAAVSEIGRVLHDGGIAKVQMPTRLGIRCLFHQARRGFREGQGFEVRYWSLPALHRMFDERVGRSRVEVDCYFGIGLQRADEPLMTPALKRVLSASEWLKAASRRIRPLTWVADSVFVEAARAR